MDHYPVIVLYMGGTCGDLVVSVIDSTDSWIDGPRFHTSPEKFQFKKPHLFANDQDKHDTLISLGKKYRAIPSHDSEYHILNNHKFISISIAEVSDAMWAANRFKDLHKPQIWNEMMNRCRAVTVDDYAMQIFNYSNRVTPAAAIVIDLSDIRNGRLINKLQPNFNFTLNSELYSQWLLANK